MANTSWNGSDKTANITLTGSSLIATATSSSTGGVRAADKQQTGKFYWECTLTTISGVSSGVGVGGSGASLTANALSTTIDCLMATNSGTIYVNTVSSGVTLGARASGDVICIALDLTTTGSGLIWFRVGAAGNWNANAGNNPATGVGGIVCGFGPAIAAYPMWISNANSTVCTANFGDTAFTGAVPSGFTSGFTSGATPALNAAITQEALEDWSSGGDARLTQIALEQWVNPATGNVQAILTQIALEEWCSVALLSADTRAMILA